MSYDQLIKRLFQVNLFGGIKLGLNNCQRMLEFLDYPDRAFDSIHVAGTNGKGSVVTKIAKSLEYAGYRVGLYTSPHISCFRERIRVNGKMISEQEVQTYLEQLFDIVESEKIPATFFEITTMLALLHFKNEDIDFAVLETGLGGRLDATNIIQPILSVITSISLDHTDILGHNIEDIALEKAGIIKRHIPVVLGPNVPKKIMAEVAENMEAPCFCVDMKIRTFEEENRSIAKKCLEVLSQQHPIGDKDLFKGLDAQPPCRMEIIEDVCPIILDVGHNPDGLQHLFDALEKKYPKKHIRVVTGLSKNKDIKECLRIISTHVQAIHFVEASNGRGASVEELIKTLSVIEKSDLTVFSHDHVIQAINEAKSLAASHHQILVICGTFFIMADAREALGIGECRDNIDLNERLGSAK